MIHVSHNTNKNIDNNTILTQFPGYLISFQISRINSITYLRVSRSITPRGEAEIQETSSQIYCSLALWYSISNWLVNFDQGNTCTARGTHIDMYAVRNAGMQACIKNKCLPQLPPPWGIHMIHISYETSFNTFCSHCIVLTWNVKIHEQQWAHLNKGIFTLLLVWSLS